MMSAGRDLSTDAIAADAARLQAAYAKREDQTSWASAAKVFTLQERERYALKVLNRYGFLPLAEKAILDIGCGSGGWIQQLIRWGAHADHITGIDLLGDRIGQARQRVPAAVRLEAGNAAKLPFAAASFDLVLQSTVFTSVLDPAVRRAIASEMVRVVKPDGVILWYDFHMNNPQNPDVRRVTREEILELFPGCRVDLRRITLAPPLTRRLAARSWLLTHLLSRIPLLCTHYLGAITKR